MKKYVNKLMANPAVDEVLEQTAFHFAGLDAARPHSSAQCMPRAMNIGQNIAHLNAGKRQVRGF
jgi:hypothetical protein